MRLAELVVVPAFELLPRLLPREGKACYRRLAVLVLTSCVERIVDVSVLASVVVVAVVKGEFDEVAESFVVETPKLLEEFGSERVVARLVGYRADHGEREVNDVDEGDAEGGVDASVAVMTVVYAACEIDAVAVVEAPRAASRLAEAAAGVERAAPVHCFRFQLGISPETTPCVSRMLSSSWDSKVLLDHTLQDLEVHHLVGSSPPPQRLWLPLRWDLVGCTFFGVGGDTHSH